MRKGGFTIVELLIVIVVISVLAAITIVAYNGIRQRAQASSLSTTIKQIETKLKLWSVDNSDQLPTSLSAAGISTPGQPTVEYYTFDNNTQYCLAAVDAQNVGYYKQTTGPTTPTLGKCSDASSVAGAGTPLAYTTTSSVSVPFTSTITGTPDVILYNVYDAVDLTASYNIVSSLAPGTATARMQMDTNAAGMNSMRYRIDTSAASNYTAAQNAVRSTGRHIGWLQVRSSMTSRVFGYDQAAAANTAAMLAGTGWTYDALVLGAVTSSTVPIAAVVYNADHDLQTRTRVLTWLAWMHSVPMTF